MKGRVAVVTGASQGMGFATAKAFAVEGAALAICSRNQKTLQAAARDLEQIPRAQVLAQAADVTDVDAVKRFVVETIKRFGRIDVCVANSGGPPAKNFLSTTLEEWRRAVELNFLSFVNLAREVIPHMQRNHWGRFIAITSISVKQPIPELVMSNAVRASVVGLVKSLANEFGKDGILVNNVAPGYTATERLNELAGTRALAAGVSLKEIYESWAAEIPLRRIGKPEEIADAIVWLASERASYITGQTILVDGGLYKGL
ncbi:MAG: SDR family oxidoreductase [Acidobacteriales bacterium]|nr:SDR family oxidoreductase [Terriglobales bacterium]